MTAINSAGAGPESAKSNSVTPTGAGDPRSADRGRGGSPQSERPGQLDAGGDGGSQITGYRITPFIGSTAAVPDDGVRCRHFGTVSGLSNGTNYTFTVTAMNGIGAGPASSASNAVMPRATIFEQGVPATLEAVDTNSVELGVKFTSDIAGTIRGIRFYKAAGNTGHACGQPLERRRGTAGAGDRRAARPHPAGRRSPSRARWR